MPLMLDMARSVRARDPADKRDACLTQAPRPVAEMLQTGVAILAEGLPGRPDPEDAASEAARTLLRAWEAAPEVWGTAKTMQECFNAAHRALATAEQRALAASLSMLVLRARRWLLGHVGDTRVWLYRDREIKLISRDHRIPSFEPIPQYSKAAGIGMSLDADISAGELRLGDVFLLTSEGVHEALDSATLMGHLLGERPAQQTADAILRQATAAREGVMRVAVVRVERLPEATGPDENQNRSLAMIKPPVVGDAIDGWRIEELMQKSSRARLYRASGHDRDQVLLKFPNPRYGNDANYVDEFLREEWIARRLDSTNVTRALPQGKYPRTALYTVLECPDGENLSDRIKRKHALPASEALLHAKIVLDLVRLLRHAGVDYPDIRPKNIVYNKTGRRLTLLNPAASLLHYRQGDDASRTSSGALSYLAPELLEGRAGGERAAVYIAGTLLYRMLTGKFPYGRIKNLNHAAFGALATKPVEKANVPPWLADILSRACAFDPENRYANPGTFLRRLVDGERRAEGDRRLENERRAAAASATSAVVVPARSARIWEWVLVAILALGLLAYLGYALL